MRVVGNFEPEFSTENDVGKAFEHLGQEVIRPRRTERAGPQVREAVLDLDLLLITSTWDEALPFGEMIKLLRDCAMRGIPTGTLHLAIFFGSDRGSRRWWANIQFFTRYV